MLFGMKTSAISPLPMRYLFLPLLMLALIAPFTPVWDLLLSRYFYDPVHNNFPGGWLFDEIRFWAVFPAIGTAIGATFVLALSYVIKPDWKKWRSHVLLLILPMALGAGILTHTLFKDHWGRPRPRQVTEFGGDQPFRPFYSPNFSLQVQPLKSFPCGHASMGFYFFSLILLGRRLSCQWVYLLGIFLTLFLGSALSITRIAQGGHFFSDTLATALLLWSVALTSDWLLFSDEKWRW